MGKDASFKDDLKIKSFEKYNCYDKQDGYWQPDLVLINKEDNHIVVCEHSTTGDRKVHIGELIQFLAFAYKFNKKGYKYSYFLFLEGEGSSPPKKEIECSRLQYYYNIFSKNMTNATNIHHIIIYNYADVPRQSEPLDLQSIIACGVSLHL
jgi:hypothetical protein